MGSGGQKVTKKMCQASVPGEQLEAGSDGKGWVIDNLSVCKMAAYGVQVFCLVLFFNFLL